MMIRSIVVATLLGATPVAAQDITVPSGLDVRLFDVILEDTQQLARFRFVAPAIGGATPIAFSEVADDFQYLCDALVIPGLDANGWDAKEVVISLASQELPFGTTSAEIAQYFQPFSVQDNTCIWEDY
jgi:hypothetical protein